MSLWKDLRKRNIARLIELWQDLRERRIFRIVAAYVAGGWLALQGADMLVGRGLLSELTYRLVLVVVIAGIPASVIVGWFHGEKGAQRLTFKEVILLSVVGAFAVGASAFVIQAHESAPDSLRERSPLELHRIAVTYFEDVSSGADLEPIAEGLTESLISNLQRVGQLDVRSRNAVLPFRGSGVPPDSIARALDVGTVVTGFIDGEEDELRITTKVVDGNSGGVVADTVIRSSRSQLLAARDSVGQALSHQLRRWLGEEVEYRRERAGTGNVTAWVLLQRGQKLLREARAAARHHQADSARTHFERADSLLALAAEADTAWVEPVVERARVAYRDARALAQVAGQPHQAVVALKRGLQHAERALAMDNGNPLALELRGSLRYLQWVLHVPADPEELKIILAQARQDLEAAVDANPNLASAYSTLSHLRYQPAARDLVGVALAARRAYEADAYLEEIDGVLWRLFNATLDLGQFTQAERWCEEGRSRFPGDFRFHLCGLQIMTAPAVAPDVEHAWRLAEAVDSLAPADQQPIRTIEAEMNAAGVLARAGLPDSARHVLSGARDRMSGQPESASYLLGVAAYVQVLLDDEDQAIELLSRYVSANPGHEFGVGGEISWRWQDLQDNPDFRRIREAR